MAINAGTVFINVVANTGPFRQQMLGLGGIMSQLGSKISRFGVGLSRAVTLPLGLAGFAATKLAVDYDAAFARISAITNQSAEDISRWRTEIKKIATESAQDPIRLADALYFLASAGLKTSQIMPVLEASAKAAAVGLGDVAEISRLTANAVNAYADVGLRAAEVTDILVAAVREGTAEPDEFANAMGRLMPIASKAQVEFNELAASLAVLSNIGLKVNEGVTAMRGLLQAIVAPGTQAKETLEEIGLTSVRLREILAEEGPLEVVRQIEELSKAEFGEAWLDAARKIIPNIRALTGALGLTVQRGQAVDQVFENVKNSAGDAAEAFQTTREESEKFKLEQFVANLKNLGIEFGKVIIPVLNDFVGGLSKLADWFRKLSPQMQENIVKWGLIAAAVGPVLRILGGIISGFGGLFRVFGFFNRQVTGVVQGFTNLRSAATTSSGAMVQQRNALGQFTGKMVPATQKVSRLSGVFSALGSVVSGLVFAAVVAEIGAIAAAFYKASQAGKRAFERIDKNGSRAVANIRDRVDELSESLRTISFAERLMPWKWPSFFEAKATIDALNEATREGLEKNRAEQWRWAQSVAAGSEAARQFALTTLWNTDATKKQIEGLATAISLYDKMSGGIDETTLKMVSNLVAMGDLDGAMALINDQIRTTHDGLKNLQTPHERHNELTGDQAQKTWDAARAQDALNASIQAFLGGLENLLPYETRHNEALADSRQKLLHAAGVKDPFGGARDSASGASDEVRGLNEQIGRVPPKISTKVETPGLDAALAGLKNLNVQASLAERTVDLYIRTHRQIVGHGGGLIGKMHGGGLASDEVPAVLQTGEFVMQRSAVRSIGRGALEAMNSGAVRIAGAGPSVTVGPVGISGELKITDWRTGLAQLQAELEWEDRGA